VSPRCIVTGASAIANGRYQAPSSRDEDAPMDCDLGDDHPKAPEEPETDLRDDILAAIAEHLRQHGSRQWKLVRERPEFAPIIGAQAGETGRRKFYRWLKKVSEPMPADSTRPHEGRAVAEAALADATERARAAAEKHLPAAPSPAFFMKMGADAEVKVDLIEALNEIWGDLQLIRSHAMEDDGSGGHRVKSAKLLQDSAKNRLATVETVVRLIQDIYDIEALHRRYRSLSDIIISELADAPDIHARVLDRLDELNTAQAMTPFAEVS
jgi:hypothetical protein